MIRKIEGTSITSIKNWTTLGCTLSQIVTNSNRTVGVGAKLYKELLATKRTYPVNFGTLSYSQYHSLILLLYGKNWITIEYFDEVSGTWKSGQYYFSDITYSNVMCDSSLKPKRYYDVSFEITER